VADYGEAIGLMLGIRDVLEPRGEWSPALRNDLAGAYQNRGNARQDGGDLAAAEADYGKAISLMQGIRDVLEPRGEWSPALRNDLASAYMNRGTGRQRGGDLASAVADYGEAIGLRIEVAAAYPQVVGIELQKTLAARSRISHFPAEWARLAAENIGRLRNTFPAEYLAANNVPIFNAALSAALDKVEPPLSPTELTRIRQALLD
jgi:tetratricopeptide (TPR) repeat protein